MSELDDFIRAAAEDSVNGGSESSRLLTHDEVRQTVADLQQVYKAIPARVAFSRHRLMEVIVRMKGWIGE